MNGLYVITGIGIVLIVRAIFVALKIKKDPQTTKYGKNPKFAITLMVIIGISLSVVGFGAIQIGNFFKGVPSVPWDEKDNSTMAYIMMQDFVKDRLKSPASAKFAEMYDSDCAILKLGFEYTISSFVDSQNTFGAMMRTYFLGVVRQTDERNWELLSIEFEE